MTCSISLAGRSPRQCSPIWLRNSATPPWTHMTLHIYWPSCGQAPILRHSTLRWDDGVAMLSAACVLPESGRTRVGQRQRIEPTDDWQQLDLLVRFPEQRTYELIRPVVLFGYSPAERARL